MTFRYLAEIKGTAELTAADRLAAEHLEAAEQAGGQLPYAAVRWMSNLLIPPLNIGAANKEYSDIRQYGRAHLSEFTKIITDLDKAAEPKENLTVSQRLRMALYLSGMEDKEIAGIYARSHPSNERRQMHNRLNPAGRHNQHRRITVNNVRSRALEQISSSLYGQRRRIKVYRTVDVIHDIEQSFNGRFLHSSNVGLLYKHFCNAETELTAAESRGIAESLTVLRGVLRTKIAAEPDMHKHPKLQDARKLMEIMLGNEYHPPKSLAMYLDDTLKNTHISDTQKSRIFATYPALMDLAFSWLLEKDINNESSDVDQKEAS